MKYKLLIIWLAFKWMFRVNLGDRVKFAGQEWTLIQGVCAPCWDLWDKKTQTRKNHVHERDFRKVWTPRNMYGSFQSGRRFYTGYWLDIWQREGIQDWMKALHIW